MDILTLYFCGSGHGGEQTYDTDSMLWAYDNTRGLKALFPGPGAADVRVYVSPECAALSGLDERHSQQEQHGVVIGTNSRNSGIGGSALKRGATGKGWNDCVALAVRLLARLMSHNQPPYQFNIVGHSRGSITVLMLLNDLFVAPHPPGSFSVNLGGRKFLKNPSGFFKWSKQEAPDEEEKEKEEMEKEEEKEKEAVNLGGRKLLRNPSEFIKRSKQEAPDEEEKEEKEKEEEKEEKEKEAVNLGGRKFLRNSSEFIKRSKQEAPDEEEKEKEEKGAGANWYETQLTHIWSRRLGAKVATKTVKKLRTIHDNIQGISEVNCFLFDPVGGPFGGKSDRQQKMPEFNGLNRVRVIRMERGGKFLNDNLPSFGVGTPGSLYVLMSGEKSVNLLDCPPGERFVIPLPGTHGAGLSGNDGKTVDQRYIGTSYLAAFLEQSGTKLDEGFLARFGNEDAIRDAYERLYAANVKKLPEGPERTALAPHHTQRGYLGWKVNAHHRYLTS
jgi:hypothetical protein